MLSLSAVATALGIAGGLSGIPAGHGMHVADMLGDASAVLFGVFGIWLGICYKEEMHGLLFGKEGDELVRTANGLVKSVARCEVLFTGMAISSAIFISSLLLNAIGPVLLECDFPDPQVRLCVKCIFFSFILVEVVFQIYGIMSPIVIMYEAMARLRATRRRAEDVIWRAKKF